jgi:hypothetical protein
MIQNYLDTQFLIDLRTIPFNRPNMVIQSQAEEWRIDTNTIYFGGHRWHNFENDIAGIRNNHSFFFISLFTIVFIDLTFFTYYRQQYPTFRGLTMYPKFGWTGFGLHYENPKFILIVPEENGFFRGLNQDELIEDFLRNLVKKCDDFFINNFPEIHTRDFLRNTIEDRDFNNTEINVDTFFSKVIGRIRQYVESGI